MKRVILIRIIILRHRINNTYWTPETMIAKFGTGKRRAIARSRSRNVIGSDDDDNAVDSSQRSDSMRGVISRIKERICAVFIKLLIRFYLDHPF